MRWGRIAAAVVGVAGILGIATGQDRISDVIYLKQAGSAFTMDVFKPKTSNHAAVIFLCSGGWMSSHSMVSPELAKPFTDQGFTMFEVMHGSQPRYKVPDIVGELQHAIRFIRANAATYGIDKNEIGVMGGSSGGHLSLMLAAMGDDGQADAKDPVDQESSRVNAVVAFFPPTDMLNWGKPGQYANKIPQLAIFLPALSVAADTPDDKAQQIGQTWSPIYHISPMFPPTLLLHGDADQLVPLQQSQELDGVFTKDGVEHKLIIMKGIGHDARAFALELGEELGWFKGHLVKP